MKNRRILTFGILKVSVLMAAGVMLAPFTTWDGLTESSTDIFIAQCQQTPERFKTNADGSVEDIRDGLFTSDMDVMRVLKGTATEGPAKIISRYRPYQGERYLIFAGAKSTSYQAVEDYRVIPLGRDFSVKIASATNLTEQIRQLLAYRINQIDREIRMAEVEKARLQTANK